MKDMETGINWLKQIYEAIKNLGNSIAGANQSDWNEADSTSASYIKNKPTVPQIVVVKGTATDGAFMEDEGEISAAEALEIIKAGGVVYLSCPASDEIAIIDYIDGEGGILMTSSGGLGAAWQIPAEDDSDSDGE